MGIFEIDSQREERIYNFIASSQKKENKFDEFHIMWVIFWWHWVKNGILGKIYFIDHSKNGDTYLLCACSVSLY